MVRAMVRVVKAHDNTQDEDIITTIRLARVQHNAIKRVADSEHRSVSGQIRLAIDEHLATRELPEAA